MIGSISRAGADGALFTNSQSNDFIISTSTSSQQILMGFASNVHSSFALSSSNLTTGTQLSNISFLHHGDVTVTKDCSASNLFVDGSIGVGNSAFSSNVRLYVAGTARIEGDLVVNGTIESIDTNITVTDEFQVTNTGTGPAVLVNQLGATPVLTLQANSNQVLQVASTGDLVIGSASIPAARLDVYGNSKLRGNIDCSNVTMANLYMGNNFVIGPSGVITNSNYIPTLDTSKIQYGTFTSNFINDHHITSAKLDSNLTLVGVTYFEGSLGVGTSNPTEGNATSVKFRVVGDALLAGPSNFTSVGHQARMYLGNTSHFIGASCNVGIVMQVPNTIYPFVLEEGTGNIGLGVLDPEERLHVANNAKIANNLFVSNSLAIGHSNPLEALSVYGAISVSNYGKAVLYTSNNAIGLSTSTPLGKLSVQQETSSILDALWITPSNMSHPFVIKKDGKTGIGSSAPSESLEVTGNAKMSSNIYINSFVAIRNSNPEYVLDSRGNCRVQGEIYIDGTSNKGGSVGIFDSNAIAGSASCWLLQNIENGLQITRSNDTVPLAIAPNGYIKLGGSSVAEERMHVTKGHVKIDSNIYVMGRLGVRTSNPSEVFEVAQGNAKFGSNVYVSSKIGVGKSNPQYALDVVGDINLTGVLSQGSGNASFSSEVYVMQSLGIGTSNPMYSLQVSNGDADFSSNVYIGNLLGIGTSNPSEVLDVANGNMKVGSNVYVIGKMGIGTSNPYVSLEVVSTDSILLPRGQTSERPIDPLRGNLRYNTTLDVFEGFGAGNIWTSLGGVIDINRDTYITAEEYPTANDDTLRFVAAEVEVMKINEYGVSLSNGCRLGVGLSNPQQAIHAIGNIQSSAGTLGPMMMLLPPIAYEDVSSGGRLILDHTIEAGNDIADGALKPLFYGPSFLFHDASDEAMEWSEARLIFRGAPLSSAEQVTTLVVQDYVSSRSPAYSNITQEFNIAASSKNRGFLTCASPWFFTSTSNERHLAIKVVTADLPYRFGSVYIQYRTLIA